eukprot:3359874-Pleurochrysis_carterae.AAC.3
MIENLNASAPWHVHKLVALHYVHKVDWAVSQCMKATNRSSPVVSTRARSKETARRSVNNIQPLQVEIVWGKRQIDLVALGAR